MGRGGAAPWERCGCPPTPPLYIGPRERGSGPSDPIWWEGRRPGGGGLPPKQGGAPPFRVPPNPRRMGPRGFGAPAHLGAGSLPPTAHKALRGRWTHPVDPRDPFGGPGIIPVTPKLSRWPKLDFLYTILYLRTIPELLVMSGISSGTPNKIR